MGSWDELLPPSSARLLVCDVVSGDLRGGWLPGEGDGGGGDRGEPEVGGSWDHRFSWKQTGHVRDHLTEMEPTEQAQTGDVPV